MMQNLKKTHFSTSIEGNVLSLKQVENVINQKNQSNKLSAEVEVQITGMHYLFRRRKN